MYWFFNCNNYIADSIKVLVYSAYKYNPNFKPICIWDEPLEPYSELKRWLQDKGVLVYPYCSPLGKRIFTLSQRKGFLYEKSGCVAFPGMSRHALEGMWSKASIPIICKKMGIKDEFILVTDPDCMFVARYDLKMEPEIIAAGPEEEPKRKWISGGIYIFNVQRCYEDRLDFQKFAIENYRETGFAENIAFLRYYGYDNISHISPDWNYKPFWEKKEDYLISPMDRVKFKSVPKLIHFQGIYKPWNNPPVPDNTDMKYYCDLWNEYLKLSEGLFKFNT